MELRNRRESIGGAWGRGNVPSPNAYTTVARRLRAVLKTRATRALGFGRVFCIACLLLMATAGLARAQGTVENDASSSQAARDEAVRAIPWQLIPQNDQPLVQSVVRGSAIYRRLPTRVIDCHPAVFTFLVQHPEVVADVWRVMGVSRVKLDKLGQGAYRGNDGAGTTGIVRFVAGDWGPEARNTAVVFADGAYDGKPFLMPIKAKSVVLLRSSAVRERNGRHYITVHADAFVDVDQLAVELVARTVQPWVNATADRNLVETLTFLSTFSRTAETNPDGMKRMAARLTTIDEPTRNELMQLCNVASARYGDQRTNLPQDAMVVAGWRAQDSR